MHTHALAFAFLSVTSALAGPIDPPARFVQVPGEKEFSGRLIVRPVQTPAERARAVALLDGIVVVEAPEVDEFVIEAIGARGEAENALADRLLATGLFEYVHPDWICYPLTTPNDPQYSAQWHHPQINAPAAWDITTGDSTLICAYTDTGIDLTHPDLAPHRVPGYNAFTDLAEVDGGDVSEIHGHGTHVAGCGTAVGDNNAGVAGVSWNSRIMMIRVAIDASGGAYLSDITEGARWAIEHGAKVVSSSYSGVSDSSIDTTGAYIKSIGGLYLYAAGNSSTDLNWFDHTGTVVVGASSYGDAPAWFTSYGKAVDVFAPGVDILSSCWGGGYCYSSGTSMATPVANGLVGLIWSVAPDLTPDEVEAILETTCLDLGAPGNDDAFWGWGRIDAYAAVQAALDAAGDCVADFDGNGSLNVFDFLAFQTAFSNQDPAADLDDNGSWNVFDFLAFQTAFSEGC